MFSFLAIAIPELIGPVHPGAIESHHKALRTVQELVVATVLILTLVPIIALLIARALVHQTTRALLARSICPTYGYSVAGLHTPSCPECGASWHRAPT